LGSSSTGLAGPVELVMTCRLYSPQLLKQPKATWWSAQAHTGTGQGHMQRGGVVE
jgi:hypothetical protein